MIAEKIKALRKQAKLSQEGLADRLHVSRQAVTKWETGGGVPDIENLRAIAQLFAVSVDELLGNSTPPAESKTARFESITEYDIDRLKSYDITIAGAKQTELSSYSGEKIRVRLYSEQLPDIQKLLKVKIDDVKQRIDIDVRRFGDLTESRAKEVLGLSIQFPLHYVKDIELSGNTEQLVVKGLCADRLEYSGSAGQVVLEPGVGHVELNCNRDMQIQCRSLSGRLDINQLSASSKLSLPAKTPFIAVVKGIRNRVFYQLDGQPTADFSLSGEAAQNCENIVELNGIKSELIISSVSASRGEA
ncbi:helix-turn-helix domain-containing protein [Neobittarella massiliensis]|uniref:helix-turn-helix domain-containing protein n=1 Tax=Neobittarella massiliensis (ex Bilen et al. 2018) TaxID=2041842 RepID=UPI000CF669DB|nr:helix-turn-helix transcriptional regulator [Neobittarella massiliensis]